jgi:protein involved in polysaccharide export with SLBB domain
LGALVAFAGVVACSAGVPHAADVAPVPHGTYSWTVEPGDVVRLKNWSAPEQSGDLTVNERGVVLVPTVGPLTVIGMSTVSL